MVENPKKGHHPLKCPSSSGEYWRAAMRGEQGPMAEDRAGDVNLNTYKLIGQKDLLLWRHQDDPYNKLTRKNGQGFWSGIQRERVRCFIVEAVNKDPNYVYSKRVWYLDSENWQLNAQVVYDRQGKLWKNMEFGYNEFPGYGGDMVTMTNCEHYQDLIRRHGSVGQFNIKKIGIDLPKQMFSIAALQQQTY